MMFGTEEMLACGVASGGVISLVVCVTGKHCPNQRDDGMPGGIRQRLASSLRSRVHHLFDRVCIISLAACASSLWSRVCAAGKNDPDIVNCLLSTMAPQVSPLQSGLTQNTDYLCQPMQQNTDYRWHAWP